MNLALRQPRTERRVRVMFVDDSAIVRGFMRRWIEEDDRLELVKVCADGLQAIAEAGALRPDVVVIDMEMPGLDGLATLPQIRRAAPAARIVMAATGNGASTAATVKALTIGASDFIAKPDPRGSVDAFHRDLIEKVVALGSSHAPHPFKLRPPPQQTCTPAAMLVAAASGGAGALQAFLAPIARRIDAPILIVEHMPMGYTKLLAEWLEQSIGKRCREAVDGDVLAPGAIFLAPGGQHMRVARCPAGRMVHLDAGDPIEACRPAADALFESAAMAFGPRLLAVVLSGMGRDGCSGARRIAEAGGRVIVQDEATSCVWEMPGAVAMGGYAEAVKPVKELS
ncbi:MAG TPA: chemotaxis-specific protein-glutamate methyltransferase CheB, partial [Hyphomonadaceae bacterium]|nr:chemotaxis-specific protein-glutamate methyltransferase CheB [Hyphomonadaceae bacterium]